MAVVAGQFGSKSFAAGRDGVLGLAEQRGEPQQHWMQGANVIEPAACLRGPRRAGSHHPLLSMPMLIPAAVCLLACLPALPQAWAMCCTPRG